MPIYTLAGCKSLRDKEGWKYNGLIFFKFTIPIVFTSPSVYIVQYLLVSKVINFKCLNEYCDFPTILILLRISYTNKMNYGSGKVKPFVLMALLIAWFTLFWILWFLCLRARYQIISSRDNLPYLFSTFVRVLILIRSRLILLSWYYPSSFAIIVLT